MSEEAYERYLNQLVGIWAQVFNFTTKLLYGGVWGATDKVDENDMSASEVSVFYDSITVLETQLLMEIKNLSPDDYGDIKIGLEEMLNNWQLSPGGKDFNPLMVFSLCRASMDVIDDIIKILESLNKGGAFEDESAE
jgi:hypothetical protein